MRESGRPGAPARAKAATWPASRRVHGMLTPNAHTGRGFDRAACAARLPSRRRFARSVRTMPIMLIVAGAVLCHAGQAPGSEPGKDAPDPLDLTLGDSVFLVLKNNRTLVNSRLDREVQRFSLRVAENAFRPHITVGPYLERSHSDPAEDIDKGGVSSTVTLRVPTGGELGVRWSGGGVSPSSPSTRYSQELAFSFKQPLLRGAGVGYNTAPVRIARLTQRINVLALRQTVIDVVSSVIRSYRDYMRAERRVEIRAKSLQRARDLLAVNELLVRSGRMAERDIVQTKADIAGRELELIAARNGLDGARLSLTDILDIDSRTPIRLTDTLGGILAGEPARANVADSVETALRHRPDYLRAEFGIRNAETRVKVAENERRWDLSATLSTRFANTDETAAGAVSGLGDTDYSMRLDLTVPLGPAAVDPAELKRVQATVGLRKARNDLLDLRQRIDIEVSNAVREVELSRRQVALTRTARELVQEKTEIEKEKLRLGLSSNFRLVAFEDDLVAAQNAELDAAISYHAALTSLDRILGTTLERWGIAIGDVERAGTR